MVAKIIYGILSWLVSDAPNHWLGYVADTIIELQSTLFRKKRSLEHKELLTQNDLDAMDATGDGKDSWAEFLEFMLLAMDKVDYDLLVEKPDYIPCKFGRKESLETLKGNNGLDEEAMHGTLVSPMETYQHYSQRKNAWINFGYR